MSSCNSNQKLVKSHDLYKYVDLVEHMSSKKQKWKAKFYLNGRTVNCKYYDTAEKAAKAVDMFLINHGKEPINILKRK